jgi:hypothetical protein
MSNTTFSPGGPSSSLDRSVEELEAHRTVGLTRVLPADSSDNNIPDDLESEKGSSADTGADNDPAEEALDLTESEPYDATRNPPTGGPHNLLETQRIVRERNTVWQGGARDKCTLLPYFRKPEMPLHAGK